MDDAQHREFDMSSRRAIRRAACAGFSLVELMIAMTLGLLLLAGLISEFAGSANAHRELQKFSQQIENGRYALELISSDLRHAGFYGQFYNLPAAPGTLPDPCEAANAANLYNALSIPVQVYSAPDLLTPADLSATGCAAYGLTSANLLPGTDVLVVRRADTKALAPADVPVDHDVYIQANSSAAEIQFGSSGGSIGTTKKADGTPADLFRKDGTSAAEIRRYHVHIYFVAPCSLPADGGTSCTGSSDDSGRPIPTLKRLELTSAGGAATMSLVPLVEGIQNLQVEVGVDDTPSTANALTGFIGDGAPDSFVAAPALAQAPNVVAATLYLLARNTEPSLGYTDTKSYSLGLAGTTAIANDRYRRHVFNTAVRLINPSARREIPQ
jgi:type IV pilus assembly protein PilW